MDRDAVPRIDWELPKYSATFGRVFNRRTAIERINSRRVDHLDFRRQRRRGRKHALAHIDSYILLLHLIATAACRMRRQECFQKPIYWNHLFFPKLDYIA